MYEVDARDRVLEIADIPQSSVGAPLPFVLSDEHATAVAYYCENTPPDWNGTTVQLVSAESDQPWAIVIFATCYAHMFGPPNDEAFSGHPLASRGLGPYGTYLVENSSWIRRLERMNSVHPSHRSESFERYHHIVLSFHDTTFECIATGYSVTLGQGPLNLTIPSMLQHLQAPKTHAPSIRHSTAIAQSEPEKRKRWWKLR